MKFRIPFLSSTCAVVALATLIAAPARAELSDEIQVYTDDINVPGEFGLELHVNATPRGRRTPGYPGEVVPHHGVRFTPELSWGLTPDWEAGLYLPVSRDANGNTESAGAKLRLKWLPVKPGENGVGWFFGANGELSRMKEKFSESRSGFELRLMGGWRNADWLVAFNPVFGWDLSDGLRSSTPAVSLGTKIGRAVAKDVSIGVEYYTDLGTTKHLAFSSQQAQALYAVVDARVKGFDLNFGVGRGLTNAADRLTVKAIVGVPF